MKNNLFYKLDIKNYSRMLTNYSSFHKLNNNNASYLIKHQIFNKHIIFNNNNNNHKNCSLQKILIENPKCKDI